MKGRLVVSKLPMPARFSCQLRQWTPQARFPFGTLPRCQTVERNAVMLVLSRKKNESIVINNDITIVVVEIRGDKVRLGVEAPKEVPVHRREVYDAIKRNEAMQNGNPDAGANTAAQP